MIPGGSFLPAGLAAGAAGWGWGAAGVAMPLGACVATAGFATGFALGFAAWTVCFGAELSRLADTEGGGGGRATSVAGRCGCGSAGAAGGPATTVRVGAGADSGGARCERAQ